MATPHSARSRQIPVAVALVLYAVSLALPTFQCGPAPSFAGWYVFLLGWMGIIALDPWWFVNIPFLFMLLALASDSVGRNRVLPAATAVAAIAATLVHHPGCIVGGGAPGPSSGLGPGGFCWVAAIVVVAVAYIAHRPAASPNERSVSAILKGPVGPRRLQRRLRLARWGGLIATLAVFGASLALPVFSCATTRSYTGLAVLMTGWLGPWAAGYHEYRWYLNLALMFVLWQLASDNVRLSKFVPVTVALLSLSALIPGAPGCDAPGRPDASLGPGAGGYLWVASFFVGALAYLIYQKTRAALPREG